MTGALAEGQPTTMPIPVNEDEWVTWVDEVDVPQAALNDVITVRVVNLDDWMRRLPSTVGPNRARTAWDLVPFFNGIALRGIHPEAMQTADEMTSTTGARVRSTYLQFRLKRTADSKEAWAGLLNRPQISRPVEVTVGFAGEPPVEHTNVYKDNFRLVIISKTWLIVAAAIVVVSLTLFWTLAKETDLIRDTEAGPKPDGRYPFSLGKTQMAFWFFLVIASYLFLWIVTGDRDTVTASVLGLIGISAATALGAAFVDAGKRDGQITWPLAGRGLRAGMSRREALNQVAQEESDLAAKIAELRGQIAVAPRGPEREALSASVAELEERLAAVRREKDYFARPTWKQVFFDLLSDAGQISFHRFQIFVWTIVLGIIFCSTVYGELAMPEFNSTLLGLMGISAGTYIGFKLPENKRTV